MPEAPSTLTFTVAPDEAGVRLDQLVRARLPDLSRGAVRRLAERGQITVDGRPAGKGRRLAVGEEIVLREAAPSEAPIPEPDAPLEVVAVDEAWVAVNKPPGCPSHPLVPGELGTVAGALVARYPECARSGEKAREGGLVHRLDRSTSGVLLAARTRAAYSELREAFASGQVHKRYLALVAGAVDRPLEIASFLRPMPGDRRRMEVISAGQPGGPGKLAETRVEPLERLGAWSLVEVRCHTGQRHQVRVHLAHAGHPLAGDALYGGPPLAPLDGPLLHASALELPGLPGAIRAPLPPDRAALLAGLGAAAPDLGPHT